MYLNFTDRSFSRDEGQTELKVNYDDRLAFNKLRDEFISYFRIISELKDLSALTNIVDVFEENNTAYAIEEKEDLFLLKNILSVATVILTGILQDRSLCP